MNAHTEPGAAHAYNLLFYRHSPVRQAGLCYGQSQHQTVDSPDAVKGAFLLAYERWRAARGESSERVHLWSSPARRCEAPASLIADHLRLTLTVDPRVYELSFGDWEGLTWAQIEERDPERFQTWMDNWKTASPPRGESLSTFQGRVSAWWRELDPQALNILIGHAGVWRASLVHHKLKTWDEAMSAPVPHTTLLHMSAHQTYPT